MNATQNQQYHQPQKTSRLQAVKSLKTITMSPYSSLFNMDPKATKSIETKSTETKSPIETTSIEVHSQAASAALVSRFDVVEMKRIGSNQTRLDGILLSRSLGGDRFEVLPSNKIDSEFGSEESLQQIDAVSERLSFLKGCHAQLKDLIDNISQGIASGDRKIFRIMKLPVEIQIMIYELVLIRKCRLYKLWHFDGPNPNFALRFVCKQIYKDSSQAFYGNDFDISCRYLPNFGPSIKVGLASNIRILTCVWQSSRDCSKFFTEVAKFKKLTVIHLVISQQGRQLVNKERSYQGQNNIMKFNRLPGFDKLLKVTVSENVSVTLRDWTLRGQKAAGHPNIPGPSLVELQEFEAFLRHILVERRAADQKIQSLGFLGSGN